MSRQQKSLMTAYALWLLPFGLGVHRMYLQRAASGLFLALVNVFGASMLFVGTNQDNPEYVMVGGTCVLAVFVWLLVDAFFLPGMVRQFNEIDETKTYVSLGAVNLDPSFSATMAQAGRQVPKDKERSAIPEGYVMPWRQDQPKASVLRYRNSEDPTGSDDP